MIRKCLQACASLGAAVLLSVAAVSSCLAAGSLTFELDGFSSDRGLARIVLFDSQASYRGKVPPFRIVSVSINGRHAKWSADDVPAGSYAAIVHHDENANDALDRPYSSLPLEPYGYSNGAWKTFGIPPFEQVAFEVGDISTSQRISIRHNPIASAFISLRPYSNLIFLTVILLLPLVVIGALRRWLPTWASDARFLARIGLALFLLTTSTAHFLSADRMALMLPAWAPGRMLVIYATGVMEVVLALALLAPGWVRPVGFAVAAMLIMFLPANIYAAMNGLPFGGNEIGPSYLWVRVPYQAALVLWTLWATGIGARAR